MRSRDALRAHRREAHGGRAAFQPRDVQIARDHAREALDLIVDRQVHLAAPHRFHVVGGQQFGHPLDGCQRRAHLVGDQRNHVVLGLLELVLPRHVGKRRDDAQHRAHALFIGGDRRQAKRVLQCTQARGWRSRVRSARVRHQAGQGFRIHRTGQTLRQILADQTARGQAQNRARAAVGKRDPPFGIGDQQTVSHGAQGEVDEFRAIQQAGAI